MLLVDASKTSLKKIRPINKYVGSCGHAKVKLLKCANGRGIF